MKMMLSQKGMTLVELLAVIVILGILATIGVVTMSSVIQHQKDRAFVGNALALKEGTSLYIQQELASGNTLPAKITYKELNDAMILDKFKDPDTSNYLEPNDASYVTVSGNSPVAVCLKGERRSLCPEGRPILYSELSTEHLTRNN